MIADAATLRSVIGLAGQYAAVDELLTGRSRETRADGTCHHLEKSEYRRRAQEVLERFSLADVGDKLAGGGLMLSQGQLVDRPVIRPRLPGG